MTEITDLTVIEINPELAPTIYIKNGLDIYLDKIRQSVNEVPDLTTAKGRARIASLAAQVSRSKTAVEKPGRKYLKRLKESVKPAEQEIRRFAEACDALRDEIRKPLTEWENEQERIKAEKEMITLHTEALELNAEFDKTAAQKFEADFELAILMNDAFDRKKAEAERNRIAYEEEIKRQAAEQVKREAEHKIQREREESVRREAELKTKAKEAVERAEREKQEAIEAERRKVQEETSRIKREAEEKEQARLAEEKRIAQEEAKKAADKNHRIKLNNAALNILTKSGINQECAKKVITKIVEHQCQSINNGNKPVFQMNY
ncbi:hypothetical protein ACGVWS_11780 [Enterobacteriaceae bacterium LUAb1]